MDINFKKNSSNRPKRGCVVVMKCDSLSLVIKVGEEKIHAQTKKRTTGMTRQAVVVKSALSQTRMKPTLKKPEEFLPRNQLFSG